MVTVLWACCVASHFTQWYINFGVFLSIPWTKRVNSLQLKSSSTFLCYQHSSKSSIMMKWAILKCWDFVRLWIFWGKGPSTYWKLQYALYFQPDITSLLPLITLTSTVKLIQISAQLGNKLLDSETDSKSCNNRMPLLSVATKVSCVLSRLQTVKSRWLVLWYSQPADMAPTPRETSRSKCHLLHSNNYLQPSSSFLLCEEKCTSSILQCKLWWSDKDTEF